MVVTLDNVNGQNNDELRPGLSSTAKITTAQRANVLVIPIQALVQRDVKEEQTLAANAGKAPIGTGSASATGTKAKPVLVQGVYVLKEEKGKQRAEFVPVETGVTGATDIEVTSGLGEKQTIVTGLYRVLRTLKSGTVVKADNSDSNTDAAKT